jgi:hypothetical protein
MKSDQIFYTHKKKNCDRVGVAHPPRIMKTLKPELNRRAFYERNT